MINKKQIQTLKDIDIIDLKEYDEANEITDKDLESGTLKNVLLLNMSTIKLGKDNSIDKTEYQYIKGNNEYNAIGYGQLEPVPQILNDLLSQNNSNEKLDLIVITASEKAMEPINRGMPFNIAYMQENDNKSIIDENKTVKYVASAVELFKYHMIKKLGKNIRFKTIAIEPNNKTLYDLTYIIRKIDSKLESGIKLYMDIHGGIRDTQMLFDAVISVLGIENINLETVFSCEFNHEEKVHKIKDVTEQFQIFKFVSGIDDFINHGSSFEMQKYISKCNSSNPKQQNIISAIQNISDSLTLCKVEGFDNALDNLNQALKEYEKESNPDYMFKLLVDIIKKDYGPVLIKEKRNLYTEVDWAYKKDLYQQALTLIEAKTPEFICNTFFDIKKIIDNRTNKPLNLNSLKKGTRIFGKENLENILYKTMFYQNGTSNNFKINNQNLSYTFTCSSKKYDVTIKLKKDVNLEAFKKLGSTWWDVKSNIRNPIAHCDDQKLKEIFKDIETDSTTSNNSIVVSKQIERFLKRLNALLK